MDYLVRKANIKDLDRLKSLESLCFDEKIRENFPLVLSSQNYIYLVAEIEQNIVGYAGASISYEQADILSVCVNYDFRKRGIAFELMHKLTDFLKSKNVLEVFLEVEENNSSAINLYKKLGFTQISKRKNYYGDKSALIFIKKL